ncbi:hypothetical protein LUZ60_014317 [Juncus effusus]|nr:hypothetical protein LUZ60_014317 [Juncus effusus]
MARALISSIRSLTGKLVETLTQNSEPESSSSASENQNKRVRDDLEQLHRTLRRIQAVLQDAEDKEILDKSVEIWLSDLRAVAHEAEDVLDEYQYERFRFAVEGRESALEASSNKGSTAKMEEIYRLPLFPSSFSSYGFASTANTAIPCGMTDRIKEINDKFMEIYEGREKFSLREGDGHIRFSGIQKRPPSTSLVDEKGVIGREEDKEKVIDLLISQSSSFVVIPIVGMGGVGKTTLAQLIYNDSRVSQLFDRKAWVSVSYVFDVIRLTREIIESITEKNCDVTQANKLQENLVEKLEGRKFLLVLDDVWNEERNLWDHFRVAFKSAKLVTILTTSRDIFVAQIMQTVPPYHLDTLLEDQSWTLFKNCVFGTQKLIEQSDLVEIGKKIVRKCGGLPLAIKALGGVLRLENIVDVGYSRDVNMISKHNLKSVKLAWRVNPMLESLMDDGEVEEKLHLKLSSINSQDVMNSEQIEEAVLNSLQPSSNVINLTIHGYNGLKFPDWFGDPCSLAKLSTLVLVDNNVGNDNLSCLGKATTLKLRPLSPYQPPVPPPVTGASDQLLRPMFQGRLLQLQVTIQSSSSFP